MRSVSMILILTFIKESVKKGKMIKSTDWINSKLISSHRIITFLTFCAKNNLCKNEKKKNVHTKMVLKMIIFFDSLTATTTII